jgi:hypothetical protein
MDKSMKDAQQESERSRDRFQDLMDKFGPEIVQMYFDDVGVNYTVKKWCMMKEATKEDLLWELFQQFYRNNKSMKQEIIRLNQVTTFPPMFITKN